MNINQNLLRLIYSHKKCNMTNQQILSVLLGMGIVEEVAIEHLNYYNEKERESEKGNVPFDMNSQELTVNRNFEVSEPVKNSTDKKRIDGKTENIKENNNMRTFTTLQLYENIIQANENLKEYMQTNESASYTAMTASNILEQAIQAFPANIVLVASKKSRGLEASEKGINPALKYEIAESVYNMMKNEWLEPVRELCEYISGTMKDDKWGYVTASAMESCSTKSANNMYKGLYEQLYGVLESDNVYESLKEVANAQEFWSSECKQIMHLVESEEYAKNNKLNKTIVENNNCSMVVMFSPVIEEGENYTFNLWGKNYKMDNGVLMESQVGDIRYNNVVNGLSKLYYNDNDKTLEYYGANGKVLEYDTVSEKLHIGEQDLTELPSLELKDALTLSGLFNKQTVGDIDTLVKMFENRDMIAQLDNCVNIKSNNIPGLYLTVIAVEEGVYVNKVDFTNMMNEMTFFKSAIEANKYIKENINYDATVVLQEKLKAEGDAIAAVTEKRNTIKERIDFLKEKRNEIVSKIESLPTNIDGKKLVEALNLVECEIKNNEEQLAATYVEPTTAENDMVEVRVCNTVGTLQPGDVVCVSATEFTSAPECSTITVVTKDNTQVVCNKSDLQFDISHNEEGNCKCKCGGNGQCGCGDCKCNGELITDKCE